MSKSLQSHGLCSPGNSPDQNTGVVSLYFLQGIFPTKGLNPGRLHCRWILYQLSHKGSPRILEWVDYPFSRGSSRSRNRTRVSCIAGRFFANWAVRDMDRQWLMRAHWKGNSEAAPCGMWLPWCCSPAWWGTWEGRCQWGPCAWLSGLTDPAPACRSSAFISHKLLAHV